MEQHNNPMSLPSRIAAVIEWVSKAMGVVAAAVLAAMMLLTVADVIGRYLLNTPITGAMETNQLLMGGLVFLAWAYTMAEKAHVTVDIVFMQYPPRVRSILSFVMMFISSVLFGLIFWQSVKMAIMDWQTGRLVKILLIPISPFKALVALGAFFLSVECMIQMIQSVLGIIHEKRG